MPLTAFALDGIPFFCSIFKTHHATTHRISSQAARRTITLMRPCIIPRINREAPAWSELLASGRYASHGLQRYSSTKPILHGYKVVNGLLQDTPRTSDSLAERPFSAESSATRFSRAFSSVSGILEFSPSSMSLSPCGAIRIEATYPVGARAMASESRHTRASDKAHISQAPDAYQISRFRTREIAQRNARLNDPLTHSDNESRRERPTSRHPEKMQHHNHLQNCISDGNHNGKHGFGQHSVERSSGDADHHKRRQPSKQRRHIDTRREKDEPDSQTEARYGPDKRRSGLVEAVRFLKGAFGQAERREKSDYEIRDAYKKAETRQRPCRLFPPTAFDRPACAAVN